MQCNKCKQDLDPSEFYRSGQNKRGYRYACKACERIYQQVIKQRPEVRTKKRIANREWAARNRDKSWSKAHPEQHRATCLAAYYRNREVILARQRDYYLRRGKELCRLRYLAKKEKAK